MPAYTVLMVVPDYLGKIPFVGATIAEWWRANMIAEGAISSRGKPMSRSATCSACRATEP